MPRSKSQVSVPVSIHQETRLLKKFVNIPEVREELGTLLAKAVATLDWLLENGTPGTKLGAAQTVLMPFVPRAPQVVESLNYDVADLDPERQEQIIRLSKEYRSILGSAAQGRGPAGTAADRRTEAQALLLEPETWDDGTPIGASGEYTYPSTSESEPRPDSRRGEQVREEYVGDYRVDSLESESTSVQKDTSSPDVPPDRNT